MSKKKRNKSNPTDSKSGIEILIAKYGLFSTLTVSIIGVIGAIITAYFGYLGIQAQVNIPINATQTVEANLLLKPPPSQTPIPFPTSTTEPTTLTPTLSITPDARTIAITEVMANPCGWMPNKEAYWNEYIELYNFGEIPIDISGWWITDGENINGNPDQLISWNTRYPNQKFGANSDIRTDTTIINPGQYALILSPQYLRSDNLKTPYLIPSGTVILTIDDGFYLGDEFGGLEVSQAVNIVVLYKGTNIYVDQVISTYGTPRLSASPKNIKDDPINRDKIPLVLGDCYSAERIDASGPDAEYNWIAIENGSPGSGSYNP